MCRFEMTAVDAPSGHVRVCMFDFPGGGKGLPAGTAHGVQMVGSSEDPMKSEALSVRGSARVFPNPQTH